MTINRSFKLYYDLKSVNNLPLKSKFVDPYDGHAYIPRKEDTLDSFIDRIVKEKKERKTPEMFPNELRSAVILSLSEECPKQDLNIYFIQKAIPPSVSELLSVTKTTIAQIKNNIQVTYKKRQERADVCFSNKCRLHSKYTIINPAAIALVEKVMSINTLNTSEKEHALGSCGMCGCGLVAKNKLNVMNILAGLTPGHLAKLIKPMQEKAFDSCWILKESLDDPKTKKLLIGKLKNVVPDQSHLAYIYEHQKKIKE